MINDQTIEALSSWVETDKNKLGGVPVLKGTRFPVAQVLAQIAEGDTPDSLANDFDLNATNIKEFLHALSKLFDQPMRETP